MEMIIGCLDLSALFSATLEKRARKVTHAGGMKLKQLRAGGKPVVS
jgi:hypothetical protein